MDYHDHSDGEARFFGRAARPVRCARVVGAHANTGPACRRPDSERRSAGRRERLRDLPSGRPRRLEERPSQQDDPAGRRRQRRGRLLKDPNHASRPAVPAARGRRPVLHHRVEHHRPSAGTSRRVHARQPPHSALPDDDREGPNHRADAQLGRPAADLVRQHGDRPAGRKRSDAGPAVEQELFRVPRQPAGQPLRPCHSDVQDGVDRLRNDVRTLPRSGERARREISRRHSSRRRSRDRAADTPRSENQQHGLRAVSFTARRRRARLRRRTGLLRSLSAGARIRTAQGIGPDVLARWAPAPFFERRPGSVAERVLPPGRRHVHELSQQSAYARRRQEPAAWEGQRRALRRLPQIDRRRGRHAHPPSRRESRELLRRVPHAADGAEHQGPHPRSFDEPAGTGEHGTLRDSQRLQRMPHRQAGIVGGRHAREMVAWRTPREAGGARRRVHRRTRRAPGGTGRVARDREGRTGRATDPGQRRRLPVELLVGAGSERAPCRGEIGPVPWCAPRHFPRWVSSQAIRRFAEPRSLPRSTIRRARCAWPRSPG